VASLLFALLIAATVLIQGASNSIDRFNNVGINNKYLVYAWGNEDFTYALGHEAMTDRTTIALAKQYYSETIQAKTIRAKELGVS
jgi:hypothetical protein